VILFVQSQKACGNIPFMYHINKPVTSSPTLHRLYRVRVVIQCCLTSLILLGLACFCLLNIGICFWAVFDLQDVYKGRINTTCWEFQENTDRLALQVLQGLQVKLVTDKPWHLPRSYVLFFCCLYTLHKHPKSLGREFNLNLIFSWTLHAASRRHRLLHLQCYMVIAGDVKEPTPTQRVGNVVPGVVV